MPFEPLGTDEKIEGPIKRERDMDTHMLFGCGSWVFTAVGSYALLVWPFFAYQNAFTWTNLAIAMSLAVVPTAVCGGIMTRKGGLAGACGFIGGTICGSIFLYLRLEQLFVHARLQQSPSPEFPEAFVYLIPASLIVLFVIFALVLLPKSEHVFEGS